MGPAAFCKTVYNFPDRIVVKKCKCCNLKIAFLCTLIFVLLESIWLLIIGIINIPLNFRFDEYIPLGLYLIQAAFTIYLIYITMCLLITFNQWQDVKYLTRFKFCLGVYVVSGMIEMILRMIANLIFHYFVETAWIFLTGVIQALINGYLWIITNSLFDYDDDESQLQTVGPPASQPRGSIRISTNEIQFEKRERYSSQKSEIAGTGDDPNNPSSKRASSVERHPRRASSI